MRIDAVHGFVTDKQIRVREILKDYNRDIEVIHIPPPLQITEEDKKKPFKIVHCNPNGVMYVDGLGWCDPIMDVAADEMDHRVLAEVFKRDNRNNPFAMMLAENNARRIMEAKEHEETMEAMRDFHASVLRSPLHTYRHGDKVYR